MLGRRIGELHRSPSWRMSRRSPRADGVDPRNLLTVQISLSESNSGFWRELLNRVSSLPAAQSAAIADCPPLIGLCNVKPFWPDGPPVQSGNDPVPIAVHWVTPGYFTALGVPVQPALVAAVRRAVQSPDPNLPIYDVQTM